MTFEVVYDLELEIHSEETALFTGNESISASLADPGIFFFDESLPQIFHGSEALSHSLASPGYLTAQTVVSHVAFRQAVYAPETSEAFIYLITFTHEELGEPIRFANSAVDYDSSEENYYVMSRGDKYWYFPCQITPPGTEWPLTLRLVIDNVHRQIITTIREIHSAIAVTVELIMLSTPDIVEAALPDFKIYDIAYNRLTVEGDLRLELLEEEPFPGESFTPNLFPGLF